MVQELEDASLHKEIASDQLDNTERDLKVFLKNFTYIKRLKLPIR